jgi:hypothetical protein
MMLLAAPGVGGRVKVLDVARTNDGRLPDRSFASRALKRLHLLTSLALIVSEP